MPLTVLRLVLTPPDELGTRGRSGSAYRMRADPPKVGVTAVKDACEGLVRDTGVVPVTIALAEGFDGEGVELVAAGRRYLIGAARTSLLTGMADEVVVDADDGPVEVSVRLVPTADPDAKGTDEPGPPPDLAWDSYDVPQGAVLLLNRCDDGLSGRVVRGPLGFA